VLDEIERVVVGKRSALTLILTTVLARGHVLIEDLPGLGKTLIARRLPRRSGWTSPGCSHSDLLPADLLGSTIYDMQSGHFEFRPGPIFTNLLLADEINRTPPKPKRRYWRRWRNVRSASTAPHTCCPNPSLSWRPTTRSNTRAHIHCRRHSWIASPFGSNCATSPSKTRLDAAPPPGSGID